MFHHGISRLARFRQSPFLAWATCLVLCWGGGARLALGASEILVGSFYTGEILRYDAEAGGLMGVFASGWPPLHSPSDLTLGPDGQLYVCDGMTGKVFRYNTQTGALIDTFVDAPESGGLDELAFGPDGNLYVADWGGDNILRFDGETGSFMEVFASGGGLDFLTDFKFGPDGNLYVASAHTSSILSYDGQSGDPIGTFAGSAGLLPAAFTFGPDGHLYVADQGDTLGVKRYDGRSGMFIDAFVGTSGPGWPRDLGFGPNGDLYLSELGMSAQDSLKRFDGVTGAYVDTIGVGAPMNGVAGLVFIPEPTTLSLLACACMLAMRRRRPPFSLASSPGNNA